MTKKLVLGPWAALLYEEAGSLEARFRAVGRDDISH